MDGCGGCGKRIGDPEVRQVAGEFHARLRQAPAARRGDSVPRARVPKGRAKRLAQSGILAVLRFARRRPNCRSTRDRVPRDLRPRRKHAKVRGLVPSERRDVPSPAGYRLRAGPRRRPAPRRNRRDASPRIKPARSPRDDAYHGTAANTNCWISGARQCGRQVQARSTRAPERDPHPPIPDRDRAEPDHRLPMAAAGRPRARLRGRPRP